MPTAWEAAAWHGLWFYPPKYCCSIEELSWRWQQGKWSDSAKSQLCPSVRCGKEASLFPIASSSLLVHHCSFSQLFSPSGMLHLCVRWEFPLWYSLILTLYLQKHWMPSSSSMLRELLCSLRKYLDFFFYYMLLYKKSELLVNQNCQVHHHCCVSIFNIW